MPFSVEPFGSCRIEGRFTPRGNEWAELLVGNLEARPGAVRLDDEGRRQRRLADEARSEAALRETLSRPAAACCAISR